VKEKGKKKAPAPLRKVERSADEGLAACRHEVKGARTLGLRRFFLSGYRSVVTLFSWQASLASGDEEGEEAGGAAVYCE